MSRNEGFVVADVATAKHSDPKFRALWRLLRDEQAMNAAVVLYEAVQLASWQHGERVNSEDAAPTWVTDIDSPTNALVQVGLLDSDHRIPEKSWASWFGSASERRQNLRDKWARADKRRRDRAAPKADTPSSPRGDNGGPAAPVRPSVPSVPTEGSVTPFPAPRREKHGSIEQEDDREMRLVAYRLKAADTTLSADVRRAASLEVERLEARPN